MKQDYRARELMVAGVAAIGFAITVASASAQTTSTSASDDTTMSTSAEEASITSTWSTTQRSQAEATPMMIKEAIQRSKARTERFRATGTPEQFGSEEPFTFDPSK
jgi:ABC-type phosphate transport system substrate-binding protein